MAKKRAEKKCRSNSGGFCLTHWSQIDANGKVCEFIKVSLENKRLRDGIEELAERWERAVDDLNPLSSLGRALLMYGPDELRALLNPPQEERDEFADITGDEAMRYGWTV